MPIEQLLALYGYGDRGSGGVGGNGEVAVSTDARLPEEELEEEMEEDMEEEEMEDAGSEEILNPEFNKFFKVVAGMQLLTFKFEYSTCTPFSHAV